MELLDKRLLLVICGAVLGVSLGVAAAGEQEKSAGKPSPQKSAGEAPKGDLKKGKQIFLDNCEICHFSSNTEKKIGPGLKGIYKRGKFADGKKVDDASMKKWIEDGGKDMPEFKETLKAEEIRDLIAFLKTL